jgi:hypothetical protein
LAIKARCLVELPSAITAKMALQRQEEERLHKEEIRRADEKHEALTRLVRYAGPETARKAEILEEIEFEIAPKGGGPPNLGVLDYVSDLVRRANGPVDPQEIGEKVLLVFPDRFRSDEYKHRPEAVTSLGRQLIERSLEQQEKVRFIEERISEAVHEEKTGAVYIKGGVHLITAKTKLLHEALKRVGGAGILEQFEEASVAKAKQKEPR